MKYQLEIIVSIIREVLKYLALFDALSVTWKKENRIWGK